jgi:hypothetical protein
MYYIFLIQTLKISRLEVFIEKMYYMRDSNETKIEKLDRIITVRMTEEDYNALLNISENKQSNVSNIIRSIVNVVVEMVKENNLKSK